MYTHVTCTTDFRKYISYHWDRFLSYFFFNYLLCSNTCLYIDFFPLFHF